MSSMICINIKLKPQHKHNFPGSKMLWCKKCFLEDANYSDNFRSFNFPVSGHQQVFPGRDNLPPPGHCQHGNIASLN